MATKTVNTDLDFGSAGTVTGLKTPVAATDAVRLQDLTNATLGLAWKDDVVAASTGNVSLAAPGAALDGVTLASGNRILLKDQTAPAENGIYIWTGAAAALTRATDANTAAGVLNMVVPVNAGGTANGGLAYRLTTAAPITLDTTGLTFSEFGSTVPSATDTVQGKVELATQAEVNTGTDTSRVVTAATLAGSNYATKKYTATFGDGASLTYTLAHGLTVKPKHITVTVTATGAVVDTAVSSDATNVVIGVNTAPAAGAYTVDAWA